MTNIYKLIEEVSGIYKKKKGPSSEHKLIYESPFSTLEPIYFWILDFMNDVFGGDTEKLIDNFASSPGSGHFSELGVKKTQIQNEAMKILGTINTLIKTIINLLYDLKEYEMILKDYDLSRSKNKKEAEAGLLALKQRWMDKVDARRGAGSINALTTGNLQFVSLRDAFMVVKTLEDVDKLDLMERVKRILKSRLAEFLEWKKRSEEELRKRFEIEKLYLKSEVNSLKLYTRWVKPYLRAAEVLTESDELQKSPELVSVFNTVLLQLVLMGKNEVDVEGAVIDKTLPRGFEKRKDLRKYYSVVFVDFKFRGIPSKVGQHYTFGGRAEVNFKAYGLNEDEILLFKEKLSESDLEDAFKLIKGITDESLEQLKKEIEKYTEETEEKIEKEEKKKSEDINPFSALFSIFKSSKKTKEGKTKLEKLKKEGVKPDSYAEKFLRNIAEANAINTCYTIYDVYKKAHGMASFPYVEEAEPKAPRTKAEDWFRLGV